MADNSSSGGSFLWFLAGVGIGTAVGVLFAPKSGRELRDTILNAADESRAQVQERARRVSEQAQQWADRGRDVINQQKDNLRTAFEAGRQAYRDRSQEGPEQGTSTPTPKAL
jgi:gas vesicle protein